jgi:riboflavin biosynthesis pyrimidine reductase
VFGASQQPMNVLLSSTLAGVSPRWEFFLRNDIRRILFVCPSISSTKVKTFSKTSEVIVLKKPTVKNPTALQVIGHLEKLGVQNLLIEGGGGVMWDFVKYNLIDEYHVTLTPRLLGGAQAPTLVDGEGFPGAQSLNLKLHQCKQVGDELYLIYKKSEKKGA